MLCYQLCQVFNDIVCYSRYTSQISLGDVHIKHMKTTQKLDYWVKLLL